MTVTALDEKNCRGLFLMGKNDKPGVSFFFLMFVRSQFLEHLFVTAPNNSLLRLVCSFSFFFVILHTICLD